MAKIHVICEVDNVSRAIEFWHLNSKATNKGLGQLLKISMAIVNSLFLGDFCVLIVP